LELGRSATPLRFISDRAAADPDAAAGCGRHDCLAVHDGATTWLGAEHLVSQMSWWSGA
jgi:hypothetical protein